MRTILFNNKILSMTELQPTTSLIALQNGHSGRIAAIDGDRQMIRRMLSLGLRVGTVIGMLKHRGNSVVIQNAGTRVALGPSIAEKLRVEPLEH